MSKQKNEFEIVCEKLDKLTNLLQHSIAVQLYIGGATQDEIVKNLHIGKATINEMVKGVKKRNTRLVEK
jgi:DNA-binding transcriptional regulator LsrR (DeoR family)